MEYKKHIADVWRESVLERFPNAVANAANFYMGKAAGKIEWPDWCALPMSAVYAIITGGVPVEIAQLILMKHGPECLAEVTAALLWSKSKAVYRFDETLYDTLRSQSLDADDEIPFEVFRRLPHFCVFIEMNDERHHGFFVWNEWDAASKKAELRLLFLKRDMSTVSTVLIYGGSVFESLRSLSKSASTRTGGMDFGEPKKSDPFFKNLLANVNLVLYLCAENADVEPPSVRRPTFTDGSPRRHRTWDVGVRTGQILRRHSRDESGDGREEADSSRASSGEPRFAMRPHIRRAHWHRYWTGPRSGEQTPILKWLSPVPVNVGEDNLPAVVNVIKE